MLVRRVLAKRLTADNDMECIEQEKERAMGFFDNNVLLGSAAAKKIYGQIADLPIIDYHCHLDEKKIAENAEF